MNIESIIYTIKSLIEINKELLNNSDLGNDYLNGQINAYEHCLKMLEYEQ